MFLGFVKSNFPLKNTPRNGGVFLCIVDILICIKSELYHDFITDN